VGRFDGQVVAVTGAGGGLGRSHALLLAAEGAHVVVNDYCGDTVGNAGMSRAAHGVVDEIRQAGGEAVVDTHDVSTEGAAVVATAVEAFGGLHAVVNNAGIANGGDFDAISDEDFARMMAIHVGGTIAVSRAAWPIFREQGYGRIVNTSSASIFGLPGTAAYLTAKGAVFGLTRALAAEGAELGIKVNAIMPLAYTRLTAQSDEVRPIMEAGFPPHHVSPFVGALASRDVPVSGETFVVGGSRAARVVLGTVPGLTEITSVDNALERFPDAMHTFDVTVHTDAIAEVLDECARTGLDLSSFV
jgi:NAD(P)-dependent dehydrogenase (short-subunit alcohol dehydrogenase family)